MEMDFGSEEEPDQDATQDNRGEEAAAALEEEEDEESGNESDEVVEEGTPGVSQSSRSPPEANGEGDPERASQDSDQPHLQDGAATCLYYDMVPTIAAPQATHINCVVTTKNLRWFFTGGQDGYIRKHDFHQSITGKVPLTVAQKHPYVDTVQKSGVLLSYWANEEADETESTSTSDKAPSPVFCLAVQREGLWILSGQYNGSINLQSVRIEEGKTVTTLKAHTAAISALRLSKDERTLLSGGWDKQIYDWDLETGKTRRNFVAGNKITGQVSTITLRPDSAAPFAPPAPVVTHHESTTMDSSFKPVSVPHGTASRSSSVSFDPLFDEEEEEAGHAQGVTAPAAADANDSLLLPNHASLQPPTSASTASPPPSSKRDDDGPRNANGTMTDAGAAGDDDDTAAAGSDNVFLSSCIDGTMSIWDRRQSDAVARIPLPPGVPPWCMSACWSSDGDTFYCGRRNQTVEEYSARHDLTKPMRTIKLPNNSGPVSSVTAMPNGRSLICASTDNVRMYDLQNDQSGGMPFMIIPGHHGGVISQFWVDETCRFAFSTSGNRGWDGISTEVLLGYEIKPVDK